jgi:hypothetical protein
LAAARNRCCAKCHGEKIYKWQKENYIRKGNDAKYLYTISDDEGKYFKVGVANNPAERLKQLQTGNPIRLRIEAVVPNEPHLEYIMHKSLAHRHVRGEWFAR